MDLSPKWQKILYLLLFVVREFTCILLSCSIYITHVCTLVSATVLPFQLVFMSDHFEFAQNALSEASAMDTGFKLTYMMDAMNCPP